MASLAPVIDGKLDEDIWKQAAVFKDFVQTFPTNVNSPASKPTEVYLTYDEKNLYIAFKCWDEKGKIRATIAQRDDILGEDNVHIWLDTYNDQRRAYFLAFNPLGIQQDGIYTEDQGYDYSFDILMESKGVIEDWGWSVEVKIPFKSLRYASGETWGFNAARNIERLNDEIDEWMPISRDISSRLVQHGKITGLSEIKAERTLEIIPSISLSESGNRRAGNRFVNEPINPELGLTLKYTITPNIVLDAAINPDFAEVEADAPVVTANQRFPIFFPEKRPFFLENADTFQTPLRLFNSRAIFDPDLAVKLTGKTGKNTFGFLGAIDNKRDIDAKSYAGVLRYKRDFGEENNIGVFGTTNHFPERHNSVAGVDGRIKFNPKSELTYQVAGSTTRGFFFDFYENSTDYKTENGLAWYFLYNFNDRKRGIQAEGEGRSRGYRSDIGFSQRLNTNAFRFRLRLSTLPDADDFLIKTDWNNQTGYRLDWQGRLQATYHNSSITFSFQRNTQMTLAGYVAYNRIYEDEFGAKRTVQNPNQGAFFGDAERTVITKSGQIYFVTAPTKKFVVDGYINFFWDTFDYDFGNGRRFPRVSPAALSDPDAPLDPGAGTLFDAGIFVSYKPIDAFQLSVSYTKSKLFRYDTNLTAFDTNIFSTKAEYRFTRFIFARSRWDYDTLSTNIRGQMLFGWNPNPGTAVYLGYNDLLRYNGYNNFINQFTPGFERDSRTLFIRASYLFRRSF